MDEETGFGFVDNLDEGAGLETFGDGGLDCLLGEP